MNIGLFVTASLPADSTLVDIAAAIRRAEDDGLSSVWTSGRFDMLTQVAVAATCTSRIELGTAIVQTYPRHPSALASQALTTQHACGGRLALGIGRGDRAQIHEPLGLDVSRPVQHMREYLTCLERLLAGDTVTFAGDFYSLANARSLVPETTRPTLLVSALGPQMLRVAGALADGTILWFCGPRHVRDVVEPTITKAAEKAGRPEPRIVVGVPVKVTDATNPERGLGERFQALRTREVYQAIFDVQDVDGPADVALIGNEDTVASGLDAFAAAGATDFAGFIVADSEDDFERTYRFLVDTNAGSDRKPL